MVYLKVKKLLSWSHMVRQSLDMAIVTVAEDEYRRLSTGKSPKECLNRVTKALESMGGLQKGNEPKYNEWDALFYLTWYQPRQINLAFAIVRRFLSGKSLHVIDVGCGSFAVQIAVAIAVAKKHLRHTDINVTIQGIDRSKHMRRIGKMVWSTFKSIVDKKLRLSNLSRTCDAMTESCGSYDSNDWYYRSGAAHTRRSSSHGECWLMAIHAVYESNKHDVRRSLAAIRKKSTPALVVVTSHSSKSGEAWFAAGDEFEEMTTQLPWSGNLPKTTAWRSDLLDRLPKPPPNIVCNYLETPVQWNPPKNDPVILFRKGDR